jgi:tetracycline 7-halogenase / FADH2 O2-dependent halogenase
MMRVDVAIVGAGFGGSVLAMVVRRLGLTVVMLERGTHPRFAIGESASPLAGVVIEQLSDRYDLPRLRPLSTYGTWTRAYPDVGCGLKRGFTYFKHERGRRYARRPDRRGELLVAASPNDDVSDTHWLRADVDHFLVREATALGAEYLDRIQLESLEWTPSGEPRLRGTRLGTSVDVSARIVVDASGPRGFLSRALEIADRGFTGYPGTQALFSHFVDVPRCADMPDYAIADVTAGTPPYPMDDAALHHVFDEGWMWVLRFDNGVTSAGIAVTDRLAAALGLADGEPAWRRFLDRYPSMRDQFAGARAIREFTWMPRLAWRAAAAAGPGWAMLPSAAGFVDPLFSTGIPLTLVGIERLAPLLAEGEFGGYAERTLREVDHTARFVAGCYAGFPAFAPFTTYSMFYFAAASFTEMFRRLRPGEPTRGFLGVDDDRFAGALRDLSPAAGTPSAEYGRQVAAATEPLNIAGLCDPRKRNWYGVDLEETVREAGKLGVGAEAVRRELANLVGF